MAIGTAHHFGEDAGFLELGNKLLGQWLDTDPATAARLRDFGELTIGIECTLPPLRFSLCIHEGKLTLVPSTDDQPPQLRLRGTAWDLVSMLATNERVTNRVRIDGDAERAQRLMRIVAQIQPGAAIHRQLAVWLGDASANWLYDGAQRLLSDNPIAAAGRWLQDDAQLVVGSESIDRWIDGVQQLRIDTERLEVRLQQLHHTLEGSP